MTSRAKTERQRAQTLQPAVSHFADTVTLAYGGGDFWESWVTELKNTRNPEKSLGNLWIRVDNYTRRTSREVKDVQTYESSTDHDGREPNHTSRMTDGEQLRNISRRRLEHDSI